MNNRPGFAIIPVIAMIVAVVVVAGLVTVYYKTDLMVNHNANHAMACTMEAKICPDGSTVGRVAPNCDFAPCPVVNGNSNTTGTFNTGGNKNAATNVNSGVNVNAVVNTNVSVNTNTVVDPTAGWKTYTNTTYGYSFKYPADWVLNEYRKSAFDSLAGDQVKVTDTASQKHEFRVCIAGDCNPFHDGIWDRSNSAITIDNQSAIKTTWVIANGQECSSCTKRSTIKFVDPVNGWSGDNQFIMIYGQDSSKLPDQILSTFSFTK
jgi:hypothetical protein